MPLFYFTKRHSNLSGSGPIFQRDHRDSDIATYSDLTRYKGSPLSTSSNDAPRGIHVNAVSLDPIATPLHTKLGLSGGTTFGHGGRYPSGGTAQALRRSNRDCSAPSDRTGERIAALVADSTDSLGVRTEFKSEVVATMLCPE
jgi:hypothetical protein